LNVVHCVQYDHSLRAFRRVVAKLAALRVAAPDFENGGLQIR
jgi:hypothetical protein